ncbi:MAG TPA: carboxylesterase family protein [Steroidobacteraceae bacterium]|nr:carboxylesterase family protein [Steroidobacteraceae bacterium]
MPVRTRYGTVSGCELPAGVTAFKRIRYAQPPVGALRWQAPRPPAAWTGVYAATEFGPGSLQPRSPEGSIYADLPQRMSEDCLFLNIWTPHVAPAKLPVMVWIHGGALRIGNLAGGLYDGSQLARRGIVVVTVGYRLGVLGYLAHPELSAESAQHSSGNYGLLDQIAALRWIRDNITGFGGDPDNITAFGESAGALSIIELMVSPLARGLFHKAILQSGYLMSNLELGRSSFGQPAAEEVGLALAKQLGAADLAALRRMDGGKLTTLATAAGFDPQATIDGWVLPRQVVESFDRGEQAPIPVIVGFNAGEVRSLRFFLPPLPADAAQYQHLVRQIYGDLASRYLELYPGPDIEESALAAARDGFYGWSAQRLARDQSRLGLPAYLYYFGHEYPAQVGRGLQAFHASELPYEFGLIGSRGRLPANWPRPPDEASERALSEALMSYFTSFAASGAPSAPNEPVWLPYAADRAFLDIVAGCRSSRDLLPGTFALHEEIVARRRAAGTQNWYLNVGLASAPVPAGSGDFLRPTPS